MKYIYSHCSILYLLHVQAGPCSGVDDGIIMNLQGLPWRCLCDVHAGLCTYEPDVYDAVRNLFLFLFRIALSLLSTLM